MQDCDAMNGLEHSLALIDDELRSHIPSIARRACTPRVMAEVDELLDYRNLVTRMMSELAINEFEGDFNG